MHVQNPKQMKDIVGRVVGSGVASWLLRSSPDRAVRVRALARDIVLCSWARHFTLTVSLSTQVYKWVPAICWGNLTNCGEVNCDGPASRPEGVEILLAASCYKNRLNFRQLWVSHGSKTSHTSQWGVTVKRWTAIQNNRTLFSKTQTENWATSYGKLIS